MRARTWTSRVASVLLAIVLVLVALAGCGTTTTLDSTTSAPATSELTDEGTARTAPPASEATDSSPDAAADPAKQQAPPASDSSGSTDAALSVSEDGSYTSPEEVALYIHTYGHLPSNFVSKTKARKAGWVSSKGNLDEVLPGMSIGGSVYYNEGWDGEELLPEAPGRTWTECDVNYHGGYRGSERLVFSNDGLIFYTDDHYQTFTQLY